MPEMDVPGGWGRRRGKEGAVRRRAQRAGNAGRKDGTGGDDAVREPAADDEPLVHVRHLRLGRPVDVSVRLSHAARGRQRGSSDGGRTTGAYRIAAQGEGVNRQRLLSARREGERADDVQPPRPKSRPWVTTMADACSVRETRTRACQPVKPDGFTSRRAPRAQRERDAPTAQSRCRRARRSWPRSRATCTSCASGACARGPDTLCARARRRVKGEG